MARSSQSVESLLRATFPIQVAVRTTEAVEQICSKNNLKFFELLKPFCGLSNNAQLKDVQGHLYNLRNVRLRFSEPTTEPIPDSKLRITLGETVQNSTSPPAGAVHLGGVTAIVSTPWFDAYRNTYLDFLKQSDHEPIKHYVAVVFVVASTSSEPLEEFSQLYAKQKESEKSKYPKWLLPHLYHYYILLHDAGGTTVEYKKAQENYSVVKGTYGEAHCFMLQINSLSSSSPTTQPKVKSGPDLWCGQVMTTSPSNYDQDEVDSPFNRLRRPKRSSKGHLNGPTLGESSPKLDSSPEVRKIERVCEEPQLIGIESSESTSSSVQPGDDPLSQFAAKTRGNSLGDASNPSMESSLQNHEAEEGAGEGAEEKGFRYGRCLSEEDHRIIKAFITDLVTKKLLPHLNEVLKSLNEWLVSRRSVRRSFSNMIKGLPKVFGGPNNVITDEQGYAHNSVEMQLRQLGDVAFLLQSYELAFSCYHQVKRDFQSANTWLYYAGTVEMCAIAAYSMSSTRRDVLSYLEEAISVYNLSCKAPYYGVRASMILIAIYLERGMYKELTQHCIRMTAEDADLHSAVCVEQAAHAFLRSQPTMPRKYALHLILAGNRYGRAAQRVHSLRAYRQALQVYHGKGWTLAEDYAHFCLAKHSFSVHSLMDARSAFHHLLSHDSVQTPSLQRLHLQDYIYVYKQLLQSEDHSCQVRLTPPTTSQTQVDAVRGVPVLPLPFIKPQATRVTFITAPSEDSLSKTLTLDKVESFARPRSINSEEFVRSLSYSETESCFLSNLRVESVLSSKVRASTGVNDRTIRHHLHQIESGTRGTSTNVVVGLKDYDPGGTAGGNGLGQEEGGEAAWTDLEMKAAVGLRGAIQENFAQSVQILDHQTDNSQMPFTVVKESVGVGVVLKNPLKGVPLLLTNLSLIWDATPRQSVTSPSAATPTAAAVCEVVKHVLLQPEQEKMVCLHITPLLEGELWVTGFLFNLCVDATPPGSNSPHTPGSHKANSLTFSLTSRDVLYQVHQGSDFQTLLSEGVQGRVDFEVRGPRLNNSKTEKASQLYGKDHRLHWRVTAAMPKVVAAVCGVPSTLLSGEVVRLSLEVHNVGHVPLNSLRLSSSLGPRLLLDTVTSELHPVYQSTLISPLVSPVASLTPATPTTPSLISSGAFSSHCLELPLPQGRLESGKGVRANLVMQSPPLSSLTGSQEVAWDIVFYYEPALISANSRLSHRVLRHSCMLRVRASLQLRATAVHSQLLASHAPSSSFTGRASSTSAGTRDSREHHRLDLNQLVVTLEAENKCELVGASSAVELCISQLSCVSPRWRVDKLDPQQGLLCLLPSESGVIHLKGARVRACSESGRGKDAGGGCGRDGAGLVYSDVPLGPTLIPSRSFPVRELLGGSELFSRLCSRPSPSSAAYKGRGYNGLRPGHGEEMVLVVLWQALVPSGSETQFSYGHHVVSVQLPLSMSAVRETANPSPYDLVKFHLEHPSTYLCKSCLEPENVTSLQRNILSSNICRVPIKITLQNCSQFKVKVVVELLQPKDGPLQDSKRHSEQTFFWTGGSKCQAALEPNSSHSLSAWANFCWPGVYNLSSIKVLAARGESSKFVAQRWQRTSFITVQR